MSSPEALRGELGKRTLSLSQIHGIRRELLNPKSSNRHLRLLGSRMKPEERLALLSWLDREEARLVERKSA